MRRSVLRRQVGGARGGRRTSQVSRPRPQPGRRMHYHPYSRGVRNHWRPGTGGSNQGARGFRHNHPVGNHSMGGRHGGRTHHHPFSSGVQRHWGNNPGGYSMHHEGYYHYDRTTPSVNSNISNQFSPYELGLIDEGSVMSVHDCVKCGNAMGGGNQGNVHNCVRCVDHMNSLH